MQKFKRNDVVRCIRGKGLPDVYSLDETVNYTVKAVCSDGDIFLNGHTEQYRAERFVLVERPIIQGFNIYVPVQQSTEFVEFAMKDSRVSIDAKDKDRVLKLTANELQHIMTQAYINGTKAT